MPRPGQWKLSVLRRSLSLHQGPESERWVGSALPLGMYQSSRTFHPGFKEDWKTPIYCEVKPSTNSFLFFLKHTLGASRVSHFTRREIESFDLHLPGKDALLVPHPQTLLCCLRLLISLTGLLEIVWKHLLHRCYSVLLRENARVPETLSGSFLSLFPFSHF